MNELLEDIFINSLAFILMIGVISIILSFILLIKYKIAVKKGFNGSYKNYKHRPMVTHFKCDSSKTDISNFSTKMKKDFQENKKVQ